MQAKRGEVGVFPPREVGFSRAGDASASGVTLWLFGSRSLIFRTGTAPSRSGGRRGTKPIVPLPGIR